jgi:hypothetical protein
MASVLVFATACTAAGSTLPFRAVPYAATEQEAANQQAAEAEAASLLELLQLPPGAVQSASPPPDSGLSQPAELPRTPKLIDRPSWWLVPGSRDGVLEWIKEHAPAGSQPVGGGEIVGAGLNSRFVNFGWPPIPEVLASRTLMVEGVGLADGSTGLRADAQVVWTVPRPASEVIPARARVIAVRFSGRRISHRRFLITRSKAVRRIATLIDGLPTVQPGVHSCPMIRANPPTLTLTFRTRPRGRALAVAVQPKAAGVCQPMKLSINGEAQTPLLGGGSVVRLVTRFARG